jgi:2,4-dienoyl-CoA reductase-like NADH-dependent reductase (Old Yellow Enzyme family)
MSAPPTPACLLATPMKIGAVEVRNRVVMTAMGVGVSNPDGTASAKTVAYYRERARGGVGLIITEYTRINERDSVTAPTQLSLSTERHVAPLRAVVEAVHAEGAKIFVQLNHPGRQNVALLPTLWPLNERLGRLSPGTGAPSSRSPPAPTRACSRTPA